MAHIRTNCKNDSTTYSGPSQIFKLIEQHQKKHGFNYQNKAITDLLLKGLKYERIVEKKKKQRMLAF